MGIIVDNFAGGGGASTGLELALGRKVDIAINHDPDAIAMHKANHPYTKHYQESVWDIDPLKVCEGNPVDVAWFSPDCKHFSKAKGGKPVDKHIRGLAWIVLRWAGTVRPKVIFLENVEEFKTWGPVRRGHPIKSKAGQTFNKFISQLKSLNYDVEYKELLACDYGAPTKRKRFFMIARCDGLPIKWPKRTHAPKKEAKKLGLKPYRAASEIIDWSIPCPSIFERKKPLTEATMKRIARGLKKFVFEEKKPFIIPIGYGENKKQLPRVHDIKEPMPTLVGSGKHYLIKPYMTQIGQTGFTQDRSSSLDDPLKTIVSKNEFCLITPYFADYHFNNEPSSVEDPYKTITTVRGQYLITPTLMINNTGHSGGNIKDAVPTITTGGHHYLVNACLIKHFGGGYTGKGNDLKEPLSTITAVDHNALVNSYFVKYYGKDENQVQSSKEPLHTITSKARFGLVTTKIIKRASTSLGNWEKVRCFLNQYLDYNIDENELLVFLIDDKEYMLIDIGMRMLVPRELYNATGFPIDYIIDTDCYGKKYAINKQVARCGNAVPPAFAEALARANLPGECASKKIVTMRQLNSYKEQLSLF